jgi:DNA-binding NarL/FixJ family response regulator
LNSGSSIAKTIRQFYNDNGKNEVALVIIDYLMPGMNGIELIKWTKEYLSSKGVVPEEFPKFAFRA